MAAAERHSYRKRLQRGLHTSVVDNASAFGFSITVTSSFGALSKLRGSPGLGEVLGFGLAAAFTFTLLLAATSGGFRRGPGTAPREVLMLGTALNFVSVGLGVGAAMLAGAVVESWVAWPLGALAAATTYITAESLELALAELVQRMRGDPKAE